MTAQGNSTWQAIVRGDLREGYGVEDIAVRREYPLDAVKREVAILRDGGELEGIFRAR